jgi:sarcosine oxidase
LTRAYYALDHCSVIFREYDIIVIGVGAMGSATCWELARRGARVLGLDRFDIPNTRGSSHGLSRMIRLAYYEHPDYVPLLRRAYELWRELEQSSGQQLLHITGGLYMGPANRELISGSLESARKHSLPHELLDRKMLADQYPQFELPADHVGLFEPSAGFLEPENCIAALVAQALKDGAEVHGNEPVESWHADESSSRVKTGHGEYRADKLIFCGGAWTEKLVSDLGIPLIVTRQVMGWVWPREPARFEIGRLPVWAIDLPDNSLYYGFPMHRPGVGFKLAHHARMQATDPDQVDRTILPGDEESFRDCLRRFIPLADGPTMAIRTCLYTNSPDSHFIIDRHPKHSRILLSCGFSGHGFKFASVVGQMMADLALSGRTALPIEFLSLARFSS